MSDFNHRQGNPQKRAETTAPTKEHTSEPTTGFTQAPPTDPPKREVGKGVGNSRRGIH